MITFRDVDKDNFQAAISLEVHENQKCFMEDNLFSIAECAFGEGFQDKGRLQRRRAHRLPAVLFRQRRSRLRIPAQIYDRQRPAGQGPGARSPGGLHGPVQRRIPFHRLA